MDKILVKKVLKEITTELKRAMDKFPPFHSTHEGYAVILEELDELWQGIKIDNPHDPIFPSALRLEAIQVAAMAIRFILDCIDARTLVNTQSH